MSKLSMLPCLDSDEMALKRRQELDIPRDVAAQLGQSALAAAFSGHYRMESGRVVDWRDAVQKAFNSKRTVPPQAPLQVNDSETFEETRTQVTNETFGLCSFLNPLTRFR